MHTSASLIGHSGSSAFRLSTTAVSMSLAGSRFSPDSAPRPFHHGFRRRGGTIFQAALPLADWQVQADIRTHLIHRPARDIIPPLGGAIGRPCRQTNGRSKRTCELTSSNVPRGASFHRAVGLEFPPIGFSSARLSSCCDFSGPPELGAGDPYAVHDHGQPTRQRHDRLLQPAVPGNLHRPGLEPGPLRRPHQ